MLLGYFTEDAYENCITISKVMLTSTPLMKTGFRNSLGMLITSRCRNL